MELEERARCLSGSRLFSVLRAARRSLAQCFSLFEIGNTVHAWHSVESLSVCTPDSVHTRARVVVRGAWPGEFQSRIEEWLGIR